MFADLKKYQARYLVLLFMLIDLAIGLHQYNAHGIWMDEGYSYAFATASWKDFWQGIQHFDGPIVVWYALLKLWFLVFPASLFSGRLLSILAGVATLPAIYLLGFRMFNRNVGVLAAFLLLCNTSWWTREETVRMYSLAILISVCSYIVFFMAIQHRAMRGTVAACMLNVFLCGLQYLIGFNQFVAQVATIWVHRYNKKSILTIIGVTAFGLLGFAFLFAHLGKNDTSWVPYMRLNVHSLKVIVGAIAAAFGTKVIVAALAVAGFVAWRYHKVRYDVSENVNTLLAWVIVPIVATIVVSIFKPIMGERYLLGCLAPLLILAAVGITSIKREWSVALLALVLGTEAYGLYHMERLQHEDWAQLTPLIVNNARPGDVVDVYSRINVVGFVSELQLEHRQLMPGVLLYPENASRQWATNDIQDHPFPAKYATGTNSIYIVLAGHNIGHQTSSTYWPPSVGYDDLLHNYKKCSETNGKFMILRYAKTCHG